MESVCLVIHSEDDIYIALSLVRQWMAQLSFSEMNRQKVLVSVSELTRNVLDHAYGKGTFQGQLLKNGVCVTVQDQGPGIPNINDILQGNKVVSRRGLGLGLAGVHRLMDEVYIETNEGGTKVVAIKWKESK